jgi:hypothetical protein
MGHPTSETLNHYQYLRYRRELLESGVDRLVYLGKLGPESVSFFWLFIPPFKNLFGLG